MITSNKQIEDIREQFQLLNKDLRKDSVNAEAFFTEYDQELEGLSVTVIFVVDSEQLPTDLDTLDKYCEKANEKLLEKVVFVNCIYRTRTEFEEDFGTSEWANIVKKVEA